MKWPTDQWPVLLQSVLKGKAQEAYTALPICVLKGKAQEACTALPISECVEDNCVKNAILEVYEFKNSEIIVHKKVKPMLYLPMRKKCTLTGSVILVK